MEPTAETGARPDATAAAVSIDPDASAPKNQNRNMYPDSQVVSIKCLLCDKWPTSLVAHFAKEHSDTENYMARLTPEVADRLHTSAGRAALQRATVDPKNVYKIRQLCVFCDQTRTHTFTKWLSHMQAHTGELAYQCGVCRSRSTYSAHKCGGRSVKLPRIPAPHFEGDRLVLHVCQLCNYAQFSRQLIVEHLDSQHDLQETQCGEPITVVDLNLLRSVKDRKKKVVNVMVENGRDENGNCVAVPTQATGDTATCVPRRIRRRLSDADYVVRTRRVVIEQPFKLRRSGRIRRKPSWKQDEADEPNGETSPVIRRFASNASGSHHITPNATMPMNQLATTSAEMESVRVSPINVENNGSIVYEIVTTNNEPPPNTSDAVADSTATTLKNENNFETRRNTVETKPESSMQHSTRSDTKICIRNVPEYIFSCNYCTVHVSTIIHMHNHWHSTHRHSSNQPFMFRADIYLNCLRCAHGAFPKRTAHQHAARLHTGHSMIMTWQTAPMRCGLCDYVGSAPIDIYNHAQKRHPAPQQTEQESLLSRPLVPINSLNLQRMLQCGRQGRYKCQNCALELDCQSDFDGHHRSQHEHQPKRMAILYQQPRFGCTFCDQLADTEQEIVKHIQVHNMYDIYKDYRCLYCRTLFGKESVVRQHSLSEHFSNTRQWKLTRLPGRLDFYRRIKVVFPNGLVVHKAEVEDSRWGEMTDIRRAIREIEALEFQAGTASGESVVVE